MRISANNIRQMIARRDTDWEAWLKRFIDQVERDEEALERVREMLLAMPKDEP